VNVIFQPGTCSAKFFLKATPSNHLWGITLSIGNRCRASHTRTWFREDIVWVKTDGASISSACRWSGQYARRCVYHMLIIRKLVITPLCVDIKLENIVISPKSCHILAHFEHLAYDNKKPVNNIVPHSLRSWGTWRWAVSAGCQRSASGEPGTRNGLPFGGRSAPH
jgi:hypothetical protein